MSNLGNKEIMAKNLCFYIEKSGKNQKELAEMVGVAASTFNDWVKGKKYPRIDKIEMLANCFGIMKSDLIEDKEEIQKNNDTMADIVDRLMDNPTITPIFERMLKDSDFLSLVKTLCQCDSKQITSVKLMLDSFQ